MTQPDITAKFPVESAATTRPSFYEALFFWFKLGWISFGGPAGQISIMHHEVVEKKRWLAHETFNQALGFCTLLPGPEAQQLSIYLGWHLHKTKGGLAAGLLFVLPAIVVMSVLSIIYVQYGHLSAIQEVFRFLRPAVLAIIVSAFYNMAGRSLITHPHYIAAFAAFILMTFFDVSFPWIIGTALVAGWLIKSVNNIPVVAASPEPVSKTSYRGLKIFLSGFLLWMLPMALVVILRQDFSFWSSLALFFSKTACITFGGAYAVIPYVSTEAVQNYEWITQSQVMDGLALGETTPGPLVMVLSFFGFMAAYNQFGGDIVLGIAGLLITAWYTFLPGFVFVFLGAPVVNRVSASVKMRNIMAMVAATVCGVLLHLAYKFGLLTFKDMFGDTDFIAVAVCIIIFTLLRMKVISVPSAVAIGIGAGLAFHYAFN